MAHLLACGDVVPGCNAEFTGSSESDLLQQVATHAEADHGLTDLDAEVLEAVRAAIRVV